MYVSGDAPDSTRSYICPALVSYQETDYSYDNPTQGHYWLTGDVTVFYNGVNGSSPTAATLYQNAYTLDATGQRLSNVITSSTGAQRTEQYGYDSLNRLSSVNFGDGETQGYTFDALGNRLTKTDNVTGNESYTFNNANMLLTRTVGGNTTNYSNDADGNTTLVQTALVVNRQSHWDSENRMVSTGDSVTSTAYRYGADGIRRAKIANGAETDMVIDASMFVREMQGGSSIATYFMGASGPTYRRDDTAGTVRWYVYDGLGSVVEEIDPSGNVTCSRKYDVYGGVRSTTGAGTSKHQFVGQLGHSSDPESGLIYMRARYMDPVVGGFISEDSGMSGRNWFTYASNSPVFRYDRDGNDDDPLDGGWYQLAWAAQLDWGLAIRTSPMFRLMAIAALAFWSSCLSQTDECGSPGHLVRSGIYVGSLASDLLTYGKGPSTSPGNEVVGFFIGYSAVLQITMLVLDSGD